MEVNDFERITGRRLVRQGHSVGLLVRRPLYLLPNHPLSLFPMLPLVKLWSMGNSSPSSTVNQPYQCKDRPLLLQITCRWEFGSKSFRIWHFRQFNISDRLPRKISNQASANPDQNLQKSDPTLRGPRCQTISFRLSMESHTLRIQISLLAQHLLSLP